MLEKVRRFMGEYGLAEPEDRILAAVSGGADSVCLLSVLWELSKDYGWQIRALHVHHGLRGAEADRDEEFVDRLCEQFQVPFQVVHRDVNGYASRHGMSVEEAGRIVRYEALEQAAAAWGEARIAVAHHQDDNAETILHHLLRGSGLRGLGGIRPVQGNRIRPLLCVRKGEILSYLKERNLSWCEDSTNESNDYTRNRIRSQLLPWMVEHVNERAVEHIVQAGTFFVQVDQYLAQQAKDIWQQAGKPGIRWGESSESEDEASPVSAEIGLEAFRSADHLIRSYLIRHMLDLAAPGQKNLTSSHFAQIEALAEKRVGSRCHLPGNLAAMRDYQVLRIEVGQEKEVSQGDAPGMEIPLPLPGTPPVQVGNLEIQAFFCHQPMDFPKNQYTKWFDYDKINGTLFLRTRRNGDHLMLAGGCRKALKRYMIDEKIPREHRNRIPLLAEENHVLWIVGRRISEYYKITENTQTILQVQWNGGECYGG